MEHTVNRVRELERPEWTTQQSIKLEIKRNIIFQRLGFIKLKIIAY